MTRRSRSLRLLLGLAAAYLLCIAGILFGTWFLAVYDGLRAALGFLLLESGLIVGMVVSRLLGWALTDWRGERRMVVAAKADVHVAQMLAELDAKFARFDDVPPTWPPCGATDYHLRIGEYYYVRGTDGKSWRSEDGLAWERHPNSDYVGDDPAAVVPCATKGGGDASDE